MQEALVELAMSDLKPPTARSTRSWWPCVMLVLFVLLGMAARASLHFRSPLVPGINGAYYLVQARAVLEHGWLGIPDLPLTFVLQATLAKLIHLVRGGNLEDCIVLAVKSADSLLPPLAAVPVFLLGMAWSRRLGRGAWLVPVVAGLLAVGMPGLSITGEFEKNALGLVWLAALIWALHGWLEHAHRRHALRVLLFLGLVGVTHIGVFGAALLFTGLTLAVSLLQHPALLGRRSTWMVLGSALVVVGAAVGLVAWKFDPARIARLWQAVSDPSDFLSGVPTGAQPGGMMRPGGGGLPGGGPPGGMMGPRGMGGPGGMGRDWEPSVFFALLSVPALVIAWWKRRSWDKSTVAVVTGAAFTVLIMTGPWVDGDKSHRFPLIAIVPAVCTALFALLHAPRIWISAPCTLVVVAALTVPSYQLVTEGSHAVITDAAHAELREISSGVKEPDKTIVIARHGLEWWTAWTLRTHIAHSRALKVEDWSRYEHVWMIEEHGGSGQPNNQWHFSFGDIMGRRAPMPGGPGMDGPPGRMRGPGGGPGPGMMPPPADDTLSADMGLALLLGGPGPQGPAQMRGPQMRGGGGPFMSEAIPQDAEIMHEGRNYTLAWLRNPPRFVAERNENNRPH
uniref:Glycosyltransferase RgtA/B/C/D-like domain-containing protein n=1 Tax=uncultured Verrucomicrobiota bacterium TaxID=156588 RepID=D2DXW1_9BACT|nr:hypothetical protein [uncultured Verrucomicrobiota bacterium]